MAYYGAAEKILGDEIIEILENNDITVVDIEEINEKDKYRYSSVGLEFYSKLGEDFCFDIDYNKKKLNSFINSFKEYAEEFDINEHAELYVPLRGKYGVPDSIRDLIDDAESIKIFLSDVSNQLSKLEKQKSQTKSNMNLYGKD